ncbi:MAG: 2Fe-2S iron-sulfur cluster binding domain-containing protein, partial [Gammaproteobacteria bacterium]|nr:2Fe-2S iron-sulfur cluster binding domain-containing protein [Gammaproteobacteria bacterium]
MNVKLNRRRFIKGVIASGIAAGSAGHGNAMANGARPAQAVDRLLSLNVTGRTRRVDVLPQETLAHTLRYKLGLTGTKLGCNRGECGACTVLLDDVPHYACSMLTHNARGKAVLTVEGLQNADGT